MKEIKIAEQPTLGLVRTLQITVDGIRYRLFRASVTVAVIAVAVAFLMNILSESLIKRSVHEETSEEIAKMELVHKWASRLVKAGAFEDILTEVAESGPSSPVYQETLQFGGLTPEEMEVFHREAQIAAKFLGFFESLNYGQRRRLVHAAVGTRIFDRLATETGFSEFEEGLGMMHTVQFISPIEDLQGFLDRWPEMKEMLLRIREGRRKAVTKLASVLGDRPILEALSDAEGGFGRAVENAGFRFAEDQKIVARQAKLLVYTGLLEQSIQNFEARQAVAQRIDVLPTEVKLPMMWEILDSEEDARWYLEKIKAAGVDTKGMAPGFILELKVYKERKDALNNAATLTADLGEGWMGLGKRMGWLLFVSMLVCGIGISNAMLMTVTERFREIATMKCLGALDSFIMLVFVLESCFLGLVGGIIGGILGNLIGCGRMTASFGTVSLNYMPIADLLGGSLLAVAFGIILAAAAAVYPSLKAARLAPMEAMRIE